MSRSLTVNHAFGGAVGAAAGCLTMAAHGVGGGGSPDSTSLTLLTAFCVAIGAVATTLPEQGPIATLGLLAGGQVAGHFALSGMTGTMHSHGSLGTWQMADAHVIATLLCVALIATASRLYKSISTTLSAVFRTFLPRPTAARAAGLTPITNQPLFGAPLRGAISRRGPPALPA